MRLWKLTGSIAKRAACAAIMEAPEGYVVRLSEPLKSREMEEKYHAMIGDIAKQFEHCGKKWTPEDMKRLLLDQFKRDCMKDQELAELWKSFGSVDMAPSLDGSGVVMLGIQSRRFSKRLGNAFITWLYSFGADCNPPIAWSEPMEALPDYRT